MGEREDETEDFEPDEQEEDEDDMDLDDDYEDTDLDGDPDDEARAAPRSGGRRAGARRLIEQAREQRELSRALADFDD